MTTYFVGAGSNTAPYDTEAKAATSLDTIETIPWVAGDIVKFSSTYTDASAANRAFVFPATPGLQLLSVTFNGSETGGLAAGGAVTGSTGSGFCRISGYAYIYGMTFASGTSSSASADVFVNDQSATGALYLENCTLKTPNANAGARITIGSTGAVSDDSIVYLKDCTFNSSNSGGAIVQSGKLIIDNLTLSGTAPTTVFSFTGNAAAHHHVLLRASDLSAVAWTNLVDVSGGVTGTFVATQCKLRSSFTVTTGTFGGPGSPEVILQDCNSGDVNYYYSKTSYEGTVLADNSVYIDASDGTNSISWLMSGNANTSFTWPLKSPMIAKFNSTLSAMTTEIEVVNDGTTFTNAQLWQETLYKGTSGTPNGTWNRGDRVADIVTAGSNQATSTSSWTGTGGFASAVKQKLTSTSFTPAEIGPIGVVVYLAANDTVYVSPKVTIA